MEGVNMTKNLFFKLFAMVLMGISLLYATQCFSAGSKKSQKLVKYTYKIKPASNMTVKNILPKIKDSVVKMKSCSYRASMERRTDLEGNSRKDTKNDKAPPPDVEQFEVDVKFMKPYLFQARLIRSNFGPEGAEMTYRPDEDNSVFYVKMKKMPFAVKRKIEKEKSGKLLVMTFPAVFSTLSHYVKTGSSVSIPGTTEINKNKCLILSISIGKQSKHSLNMNSLNGDLGIPAPIKEIVLENIEKRFINGITRIDYFVNTDDYLPVLIEEYAGDELYARVEFEDIELNSIKMDEF
jgi:hypothetical protein